MNLIPLYGEYWQSRFRIKGIEVELTRFYPISIFPTESISAQKIDHILGY